MTTANQLRARPPLAEMTRDDDPNRIAVQGLLADADRALALTDLQDVRGNREIFGDAIASARQNYIDLVRRHRRLTLSDGEQTALQQALHRLRARLRFFGASV
ncbi:MAG: hypothetical protein ABSA94_20425 [Acidobacteriaceae bacterium]